MARSRVLNTARGQIVLLPGDVALPRHVRAVEIIKIGRDRLISPVGEGCDVFFADPRVSEDFVKKRLQPRSRVKRNVRPNPLPRAGGG